MKLDATLAALATSLSLTVFLFSPSPYLALPHRPLALTLSLGWLAWRLLCLDRAWAHHRAWTRNPVWQLPVTALATQAGTSTHDGAYLGQAFPWTSVHTQQLETALAVEGALPVATDARGGHPALHAVGQAEERPLVVPWSEMVGHMGIRGTTRAGKSRLFEVLASETMRGRGAVVMLDPKGDRNLLTRCATEARRLGRRFKLFAPAFPAQSAHFDPLATATTPEEVSARIRALMPSAGGRPNEPFFEEYALALIERQASAQAALGQPWSLEGLYAVTVLRGPMERLLMAYLQRMGCPPLGNVKAMIAAYRKSGHTDLLAEALIDDWEKPRDHFTKVTSSLIPAFRGVVRGTCGPLLTPGDDALTWARIVEEEQVVYLSLASMLIGDIANRVGRILLQDLVGYLGKVYAYTAPADMHPLTVCIDEFGDVAYPGFLNVLNKGGGANARFIVAQQSLADTEVAVGREQTQRIMDNLNTQVFFRLLSNETAESTSDSAGVCTVQLPETGVTVAYGGTGGLSGASRRSLGASEVPLIRPQWLKALPRGEAFVQLKGEVWKVRVPLLTPVDEGEVQAVGLTEMWDRLAPDTETPSDWFDDEADEAMDS